MQEKLTANRLRGLRRVRMDSVYKRSRAFRHGWTRMNADKDEKKEKGRSAREATGFVGSSASRRTLRKERNRLRELRRVRMDSIILKTLYWMQMTRINADKN